jgi:pimeloyl-ACP methyl ester carboxylesterase
MSTIETRACLAEVNGIELHYELRGQGEPLVLLHGFSGSGADWAHVYDLDELARSYQLVIPDMRGHGRSSNPRGTFTHLEHALDVLALLGTLGIHKFKAIGLSMGANTLLHVATRQPERVGAMVIVAATSYFPEQARKIMRTLSDEGRSDEEWTAMRARHTRGDDQVRALFRQTLAFADSYDDLCFTPPSLARITARTLIVNGDRDPLYPLEIHVEMVRSIPGSSLWIIPSAGHGPIFGAWRGAFVRASTAFLRDELAESAAFV